MSSEFRGLPIRELSSWPSVSAIVLMAVNDHYLKHRFGNWWTGKLSDFAGLFVLPLVLTATWNSVRTLNRDLPRWKYPLTRNQLVAACTISAVYFAAINLSVVLSQWIFEFPLSVLYQKLDMATAFHVVDTEDLIALPMVLASYYYGRRFAT